MNQTKESQEGTRVQVNNLTPPQKQLNATEKQKVKGGGGPSGGVIGDRDGDGTEAGTTRKSR